MQYFLSITWDMNPTKGTAYKFCPYLVVNCILDIMLRTFGNIPLDLGKSLGCSFYKIAPLDPPKVQRHSLK
jgi:hypothetical protein